MAVAVRKSLCCVWAELWRRLAMLTSDSTLALSLPLDSEGFGKVPLLNPHRKSWACPLWL